jgi:hypothetical protein
MAKKVKFDATSFNFGANVKSGRKKSSGGKKAANFSKALRAGSISFGKR